MEWKVLNTAQENLMKIAQIPSLPDRPRRLWRFFSTVIRPAFATIQAIDGINASWLTFFLSSHPKKFWCICCIWRYTVYLWYLMIFFDVHVYLIFILSDCIKTNSPTSNSRHPLCHWVRLCQRTVSILQHPNLGQFVFAPKLRLRWRFLFGIEWHW